MPITILRLDRVDSTNLEVRRRVESGATDDGRVVVISREQDAGIGREGRRWTSPNGGLWMTVGCRALREPAFYTTIPLLAGIVCCEALEELCDLSPRIKWPNDLLVNDRKLAGILCQSFTHRAELWLMVGIGINGNYPVSQLSGNLRVRPTTLLEETGVEQDIEELGEVISTRIMDFFGTFEGTGIAPMLPALQRRLAWLGERVKAENTEGGLELEGTIEGIDESGRLLLRVEGRLCAFASGELSHIRTEQQNTTRRQ